jgi:multisubunit Na+/H+ antiporter MnhB subunit
MTGAELVMDLLLTGALLLMAGLLLTRRHFLQSAVIFIAFGLFMALAWVRLGAPDIALAEAAIGAGITGVLLMDAIRHMEWEKATFGKKWGQPRRNRRKRNLPAKLGFAVAMLLIGTFLIMAALSMPDQRPGLAEKVANRMDPLENPVTAVLLVFRGLDTWLEMGILLLAVLGMLAVRKQHGLQAALLAPPRDPVLEGVVRMLAPLTVLAAMYFLWLGTFSAGGAFQSGVVLGATAILLWLARHPSIGALPQSVWKLLMLLGFAVFTLVAVITLSVSEWMLQFPDAFTLVFIEIIEMAAAISIGACLAGLFVGQHPALDTFAQNRAGGAEPEEARD